MWKHTKSSQLRLRVTCVHVLFFFCFVAYEIIKLQLAPHDLAKHGNKYCNPTGADPSRRNVRVRIATTKIRKRAWSRYMTKTRGWLNLEYRFQMWGFSKLYLWMMQQWMAIRWIIFGTGFFSSFFLINAIEERKMSFFIWEQF